MKIDKPPPGAPLDAVVDYMEKVHECYEVNHAESMQVQKGIRWDGQVNIVALLMVVVSMVGGGVGILKWIEKVDMKLDAIPELVTQDKVRDARLGAIDSEIADLTGVTVRAASAADVAAEVGRQNHTLLDTHTKYLSKPRRIVCVITGDPPHYVCPKG